MNAKKLFSTKLCQFRSLKSFVGRYVMPDDWTVYHRKFGKDTKKFPISAALVDMSRDLAKRKRIIATSPEKSQRLTEGDLYRPLKSLVYFIGDTPEAMSHGVLWRSYANAAYLAGKYKESIEACSVVLGSEQRKKFSDSIKFNTAQIAVRSLLGLSRTEEALELCFTHRSYPSMVEILMDTNCTESIARRIYHHLQNESIQFSYLTQLDEVCHRVVLETCNGQCDNVHGLRRVTRLWDIIRPRVPPLSSNLNKFGVETVSNATEVTMLGSSPGDACCPACGTRLSPVEKMSEEEYDTLSTMLLKLLADESSCERLEDHFKRIDELRRKVGDFQVVVDTLNVCYSSHHTNIRVDISKALPLVVQRLMENGLERILLLFKPHSAIRLPEFRRRLHRFGHSVALTNVHHEVHDDKIMLMTAIRCGAFFVSLDQFKDHAQALATMFGSHHPTLFTRYLQSHRIAFTPNVLSMHENSKKNYKLFMPPNFSFSSQVTDDGNNIAVHLPYKWEQGDKYSWLCLSTARNSNCDSFDPTGEIRLS